jgi:hypothetical protein
MNKIQLIEKLDQILGNLNKVSSELGHSNSDAFEEVFESGTKIIRAIKILIIENSASNEKRI